MAHTSDDDSQKEADRLLSAVFARSARWPLPTGVPLYKPRSSDVIVSTFPKAGTTLLQNMAYQIAVATGGAPSFDPDGTNFTDITEVTPWIDYAPQFGVFECDTSPRIFKTHGRAETYEHLLTKAKYIYCIRNPEQYPASWLDFLFEVLSEEEEVKDPRVREEIFHLFVRRRLLGILKQDSNTQSAKGDQGTSTEFGPWITHIKGWIDTPRENILVLFYEDMLRDLRGTILCVARFMNRTLSPEALETVLKRCDRNAMAGNPRFNCQIEARAFGFSEKAEKAKKEDRCGYKAFSIKEEDKQTLSRFMKQALGVGTYTELQNLVRKRQQDLFPATAYKQ